MLFSFCKSYVYHTSSTNVQSLTRKVMGSCFLAHSLQHKEGMYNAFAVQSRGSLTLVALSFLVMLAAPDNLSGRPRGIFGPSLRIISHAMAICLLVFYLVYLFFETQSHAYIFDEDDHLNDLYRNDESVEDDHTEDQSNNASPVVLYPISASLVLIACLTGITFFALALLSNLSEHTFSMNKTFIGFILFPFLGNVTDYIFACAVAYKNQLDITLLNTLGSAMQISVFTLPVLEILGWIIDKPMTLQCPPFEITTVFFSALVIIVMMQTARSNYLSGAMCISL